MLVLYELINLLPQSFKPNFSNRLNELFFFLQKEKKLTEKEALLHFLGNTQQRKYFNKLKNELKDKLMNYVLVSPSVWADAKYKALHEQTYKHFASYRIFLISGCRNTGIEIAKDLLSDAQQLELHNLAYTIATDLQFHYSSIDAKVGLARKFRRIAEKNAEIIKADATVQAYHSEIGLVINTRESFTKAMVEEFKEAVKQTKPFLLLGSHRMNRFIYNIITSRYLVEYDYKNIVCWSQQALASFPKDHPNIIALRFSFIQKQLYALVALNELEKAKTLAKEACQMMPVGNFNWHLALIRRVFICLYTGEYQEAYDLFKAHAQQKCSSRVLKEYWNILKGYLYFLIRAGRVEQYEEEKFNLGKFLNEMPIYSKDKAGNNINILIIQILVQMQRDQFGVIIDRIESLSTYARMYTRNPETARANIFINMIMKMESASFHRSGTERKTKRLVERLANTPLKIGQNLAIEVIPYEVLWEEMLSMLDNKFRGKTVRKSTRPTTRKNKT